MTSDATGLCMRRYDVADSVLLQQVADGDEAALRALFDRHAAWLQLRLQRRTSEPDLVADVSRTPSSRCGAALRLPRRRRRRGWLWGIAIRRLDLAPARPPRHAPAGDDLIARLSPPRQSAEDELLVGVEYGDVGAALRSLSPELRTVVQATVIDGLTTREAASLLGIPQGTVKSRMRAAKAQLRGPSSSREGSTAMTTAAPWHAGPSCCTPTPTAASTPSARPLSRPTSTVAPSAARRPERSRPPPHSRRSGTRCSPRSVRPRSPAP